MTTRSLHTGLSTVQSIAPLVHTADATGAAIDTQGFDSLMLIGSFGISGDTLSGTVYAEAEVEVAPDNGSGSPGTWRDATDAEVVGSVTGTNTGTFAVVDDPAEDDAVYTCSVVTDNRFVRVIYNITGTHTVGMEFAALGVLGHGHRRRQN